MRGKRFTSWVYGKVQYRRWLNVIARHGPAISRSRPELSVADRPFHRDSTLRAEDIHKMCPILCHILLTPRNLGPTDYEFSSGHLG